MDAATTIGAGAEPIESIEWLHDFDQRYMQAWNSQDPAAVAAAPTLK